MRKYLISKDFIVGRYFGKDKSQDEIGKELGISQWVISQRMKEFNLKTKDKTRRIILRTYQVNDHYFDQINQENAWVLGWLLSDGFVQKNYKNHRFGLRVSSKDADIVYKIKRLLGYSGPVLKYQTFLKKTGRSYSGLALTITSPRIVRKLQEFGINQGKSTKEIFPEAIKKSRNEGIIKSFILGIFEGDGSILWDKKRRSLLFQIVGSKRLLLDIQNFLIMYLGLERTKLTHNVATSDHFALRYRGNMQALKIFSWLYDNSHYYLNRKHNEFLAIRKELAQ